MTLTPSEDLVLEVLAARYRLGENAWTFKTRHGKALSGLVSKGLVWTKPGVIHQTLLAALTDEGRAAVLSPTYVPPRAAA